MGNNKKKSIGALLLGKWDTKTIVGIAIGAALFGVLMDFGGIKVTTNTSLTSAYVVLALRLRKNKGACSQRKAVPAL